MHFPNEKIIFELPIYSMSKVEKSACPRQKSINFMKAL